MAVRHQRYTGPPRVPVFGGGEPTPPPGALCDKCAHQTSRYNPHGRCYQCCQRHGYPLTPTHDVLVDYAHTADCECRQRRIPRMNPDGTQARREGRADKRPVWDIEVTCPHCGKARLVTLASSGRSQGPPCQTEYERPCTSCGTKIGRAKQTGKIAQLPRGQFNPGKFPKHGVL